MKRQNALHTIKDLLKRPYFTSKEARERGMDAANLAYYIKREDITRLGHGIYRGSQVELTEDFRWEEIIETTQVVKNGVICMITALIVYEITEEMPHQVWIAVPNATRHRTTSHLIRVVRMRNMELGRTAMQIGKLKINIFDRERTIVDAFRYLSMETALKALKMALTKKGAEKLNLTKLSDYARKLHVDITPYLLAMMI